MPGEDYSRGFCGCQLVLPIFCSWRNANIVTLVFFFVCLLAPLSTVFDLLGWRVRTCLEEDFHWICPKKGPAVLASVTKNLLVVAQ